MLQSALEHYRRQQRFTAAAVVAARRKGLSAEDIARIVAPFQLLAAKDALASVPQMLEEQNITAPLPGFVPAAAFAGTASDGRSLIGLFTQAVDNLALDLMVATQIQDAARQAAAVSIASRPRVGYVRMLNPPSCSRCVLLAGKFYKSNAGFERHPRCDCRHVPSIEDVAGDLRTRPDVYFDSLTPAEQDRIFTKAGAEAIRQGADIGQVVNARRGMTTAQSGRLIRNRHGDFSTKSGTRGRRIRLMPESILEIATSPEDAQRLFRLYGYLLP